MALLPARSAISSSLARRAFASTSRSCDARRTRVGSSTKQPQLKAREILDTLAADATLLSTSRAPTSLKSEKPARVKFEVAEGQSNDRRAYFVNDVDAEVGLDWGSIEGDGSSAGLEIGRVVECRR